MHSTQTRISGALLALLTGVSLLTACSRDDNRSAGQKVDQAIASTERKADEVAADARQVGRDARQAMGDAVDTAARKSKDVAITAAVKTRLAGDSRLSALAINVDTDGGRVVLQGTAPDTAARSHAAELARAVDGVVAVENQLDVQRTN
jgi:hypothetical protein